MNVLGAEIAQTRIDFDIKGVGSDVFLPSSDQGSRRLCELLMSRCRFSGQSTPSPHL